MGVEAPIPKGGHFPAFAGPEPSPLETFLSAPVVRKNHPSFAAKSADGSQPARAELQALLDKGFGRLYRSQAEAEQVLGGRCHPAPLGDVVKDGPGGKVKHRLIQDLRRNHVNECVRLPERQVLPRGVDHASDLAAATAAGEAETFTCDFLHAFMAVPSSPAESRYTCCLTDDPMRLGRAPLDDAEPHVGLFIVWLVLGFGGRA